MEYKYTADGKKVVVVGKVNSEQFVVQEIYVNEQNQEFPGGENFVVTSLLDEPAKTYQSKNVERLEQITIDLKQRNKKLEEKMRVLSRDLQAVEMINRLTERYADFDIEQFADVIDFMSGKITHVVIHKYSEFEILPLNEALASNEGGQFDGLKMLTLFGVTSDGRRYKDQSLSLQFKINRWSDGSGNNTHVYPFRSYDEACDFVSQKIANHDGVVRDEMLKAQEKYGLAYPSKEQAEAYWAEKKRFQQSVIDKHQELIDAAKKAIDEIEA